MLRPIKEICSNYGELNFIWFDTPGQMTKKHVSELLEVARTKQPGAMLCSRIGQGQGDYSSLGDMQIPSKNINGYWETCDTHNDSWGFASWDKNFKGPQEILERLISTVSRGGTYLFNIGPDGEGKIPEFSVEFLTEAGKWIKKYPELIYKAGSSPWQHALAWGDATTQKNKIYLSVFDWPQDGKLYLPGISGGIDIIRGISGDKAVELNFEYKNNWMILDVPYKALDEKISVIEVRTLEPVENLNINTAHGIYPNHLTEISSEFASVQHAEVKESRWMEKYGEWKHVMQINNWAEKAEVKWTVNVFEPGYYNVSLNFKGDGRLVWKIITSEGEEIKNQQPAANKYAENPIGLIPFHKPGIHTISVFLEEGNSKAASLKSIIIEPVK